MTKEDLIKDLDKISERKKPIEKSKPKSVKRNILPGEVLPVEKTKKKLSKTEIKIVEDVKKLTPIKEHKKEEIKVLPVIEFEIRKTTKFDLNWFYFKKLFINFEKWISAPYTYAFWEKRGFKKKEKTVTITNSINNEIIIEKVKELKEEINKPLTVNHWDVDKPLSPEEIQRIRKIRELLKDFESPVSKEYKKQIFESDK